MAEPGLRLAIDIGNTRLHAGIIDGTSLTCCDRDDYCYESHAALIGCVEELERKFSSAVKTIIISSVVKLTTADRDAIDAAAAPVKPLYIHYHDHLPVKFHYVNKDKLGADRIANALFAVKTSQTSNVIIISAGTAVTIDLVSHGQFMGGTILPGPTTQFRSLSVSTSALPMIHDTTSVLPLPGTSTEQCITAGVLYGLAGGIDHIVNLLVTSAKGEYTILATGGAWNQIAPLIHCKYTHVPDLTLIGTALFEE